MTRHPGPAWPAILKLEGVDELTYLENEAIWQSERQQLGPGMGDWLIDRHGRCFHIPDTEPGAAAEIIPLGEFEALIRAHLVAMQQCCVYKIELKDYEQGLRLVADAREP